MGTIVKYDSSINMKLTEHNRDYLRNLAIEAQQVHDEHTDQVEWRKSHVIMEGHPGIKHTHDDEMLVYEGIMTAQYYPMEFGLYPDDITRIADLNKEDAKELSQDGGIREAFQCEEEEYLLVHGKKEADNHDWEKIVIQMLGLSDEYYF